MDADDFEKYGTDMVKYIARYMRTLPKRRVSSDVEPGYMRDLLPKKAPTQGEDFYDIMKDVEKIIMPGAASPACTELEIVVLDWLGKLIKLPPAFLHEGGKGGGVIQGSASECVLVTLLASRHAAIAKAKAYPYIDDGYVLSKLVAYSSKLAHSCVEKAGMIGLVKMRQLDVDENYSLRGYTLERAIEVCATLGTTGCCSFDNVQEVGEVCAKEKVWLHVDAAYAGNALICPEFQYLLKGIEHWGIPLSRRFRALKLWFVLRVYGVNGLQEYIRKHIRLAKLMEQRIRRDPLFEVVGNVVMGLVCFRLKGPNALTVRLLKTINESRRLHMVPALVNENYVIRFAICAENACDDDIKYAWDVISDAAEKLMSSKCELEKSKVHGRSEICELSETESEDEVFDRELFDRDIIFDQQMITLKRACERRNLFHRMVSDPKGFNRTLLKALSIDGNRKIRSESDLEEENGAHPIKTELMTSEC
ncbi:decarboxylase [Mactra antiquata]